MLSEAHLDVKRRPLPLTLALALGDGDSHNTLFFTVSLAREMGTQVVKESAMPCET